MSDRHPKRHANITQLAALWSREYVCETDGCEARKLLQIDHIAEYAKTRRTCATDLGWKSPHCHDLTTNHGDTDSALQPNGRRTLKPPERPPPEADTS